MLSKSGHVNRQPLYIGIFYEVLLTIFMGEAVFKLKPYTAKQLADMYEVSLNTFKKWVRKHEAAIGPKEGHFYNIFQVEIIVSRLGYPRLIHLGDWSE